MNTRLHAVTDAEGRPIRVLGGHDPPDHGLIPRMTAGQVSDYTGAAALLGSPAKGGLGAGRQ